MNEGNAVAIATKVASLESELNRSQTRHDSLQTRINFIITTCGAFTGILFTILLAMSKLLEFSAAWALSMQCVPIGGVLSMLVAARLSVSIRHDLLHCLQYAAEREKQRNKLAEFSPEDGMDFFQKEYISHRDYRGIVRERWVMLIIAIGWLLYIVFEYRTLLMSIAR